MSQFLKNSGHFARRQFPRANSVRLAEPVLLPLVRSVSLAGRTLVPAVRSARTRRTAWREPRRPGVVFRASGQPSRLSADRLWRPGLCFRAQDPP